MTKHLNKVEKELNSTGHVDMALENTKRNNLFRISQATSSTTVALTLAEIRYQVTH